MPGCPRSLEIALPELRAPIITCRNQSRSFWLSFSPITVPSSTSFSMVETSSFTFTVCGML